jgi:protein N-terminal methyltransferase
MPDPHPPPPAPDALISRDDGRQYWEGIAADVDGMLGGFAYISKVDLQGSRNFLARLGIGTKPGQRRVGCALEGGAGIGRVTDGLLLRLADAVDVVEPMAKFTAALEGRPGVRTIFNVGLEDWRPEEGVRYGLVWTQWCVGHLTDEQLVAYLRRCGEVLDEGGVVVIKENLSTSGVDLFDDLDSSVTR